MRPDRLLAPLVRHYADVIGGKKLVGPPGFEPERGKNPRENVPKEIF